MVLRGFLAGHGERAERVGFAAAEGFEGVVEIVGVPELLFSAIRHLLEPEEIPRLRENHDPRSQRHDEQNDGGGAHDEIALRPEVRKSEVLHVGFLVRSVLKSVEFEPDRLLGGNRHGTTVVQIGLAAHALHRVHGSLVQPGGPA